MQDRLIEHRLAESPGFNSEISTCMSFPLLVQNGVCLDRCPYCWDRLIRKWRGNSNHSRRKINLNLRQSQAIAVQMEPGFQITSNVLESQLCTKELECIFSPHNKYANEDAAMY